MSHHFFVSCVFGWATSVNAEEAVAKLARSLGPSLVKRMVVQDGGVLATVYRVDLPEEALYNISEYKPSKCVGDGVVDGAPVPYELTKIIRIKDSRGAYETDTPQN